MIYFTSSIIATRIAPSRFIFMKDKNMSKPWVAFWKADLLSSINYRSLSVYERGIYNILFTLCRDDEYIGQLCYPNGNPMTLDQVIDSMDLKRGDRRDRIKEAIGVMLGNGLVFWNDKNRLEIRKYAEKTQHIEKKSSRNIAEVGTKLAHSSPKLSTDLPIQHNTTQSQHNTTNKNQSFSIENDTLEKDAREAGIIK